MNIKIDLVISADSALLAALQGLLAGTTAKPLETKVVDLKPAQENGEEKKTRKKAEKETVPAVQEQTQQEPATGTAQQSNNEVKTDLTLDIIRKEAVPRSKAGHKDKIKAKITELGYESLEDMQPVHFEEFNKFLQTIPKP